MSLPALITTGLPLASWMPVAQDLLDRAAPGLVLDAPGLDQLLGDIAPASEFGPAHLGALQALKPEGTQVWGLLAADAVEHVGALARALPGTRLLVLVRSPERSLADWLRNAPSLDPRDALQDWARQARALIRAVQDQPDRIVVVDAGQAETSATAFTSACRQHLGLAFVGPELSTTHAPGDAADALHRLVARSLVAEQAELAPLGRELQAVCLPLADAPDAATPAGLSGALAAWQNLSALHRLATVDGELEGVRRQSQALRRERDSLLRQQHGFQTRFAALMSEVAATEAAHKVELQAERDKHAAALEATSDELQVERDQRAAELASAEQRLADELAEKDRVAAQAMELALAGHQSELDALQAAYDAQASALQSAGKEALKALQARLDALQADTAEQQRLHQLELATAAARLETLGAEAKVTRDAARSAEDRAALLTQRLASALGQVEKELTERDTLVTLGRLAQTSSPSGVVLGEPVIGQGRDEPPHRELGLRFARARVHGRAAPLELRLVEHHGRPGLVLLGEPGATPVLGAWHDDGQEDGRSFMLVVPEDESGSRRIESMSARDWLFVRAAGAAVELALRHPEAAVSPRWPQLARRLNNLFDRQPARWRADGLSLKRANAGHTGLFELQLATVDFDGRTVRALRMAGPVDERGRAGKPFALQWQLPTDPDSDAALDAWPIDDQGLAQRVWEWPCAPLPVDRRRRRWSRLSEADHRFTVATMRAVADLVRMHEPVEGLDTISLAAAFQRLADGAERDRAPALWRRWKNSIRRALGRG